ncbi:hypothetical protein LGH83_16785 [Lichenihabitans sp. PAMC28606]|uniref:hypothetical protein n=1 Tax=Lichenihabitans sp. PAMC28606 TaxID=2880932 RepID=UPI001D0AB955|nr:hypothetical protein [Lichenihabitans sp. PAMC28606]UDL94166.1 hypothetical protein LGH83_16785 [Lichenihabitans sp. PAMC28606]
MSDQSDRDEAVSVGRILTLPRFSPLNEERPDSSARDQARSALYRVIRAHSVMRLQHFVSENMLA